MFPGRKADSVVLIFVKVPAIFFRNFCGKMHEFDK